MVGAALEVAAMLLAIGLYLRTCWLYTSDSSDSEPAYAGIEEGLGTPLHVDCTCQVNIHTQRTAQCSAEA